MKEVIFSITFPVIWLCKTASFDTIIITLNMIYSLLEDLKMSATLLTFLSAMLSLSSHFSFFYKGSHKLKIMKIIMGDCYI